MGAGALNRTVFSRKLRRTANKRAEYLHFGPQEPVGLLITLQIAHISISKYFDIDFDPC